MITEVDNHKQRNSYGSFGNFYPNDSGEMIINPKAHDRGCK